MIESNSMAAELLDCSATAYAAYASNRLLEKNSEVKNQFRESAFNHWRDHFCQRIKELSVAIAENEPALFVSRVRWSRAAFRAREISDSLLRESLVCLNEVLKEELPEAYRHSPAKYIAAALQSLDELEQATVKLDSKDPVSNLAMQYLLQVLEGNSQHAIKLVVDAQGNGMPLENIYQALISAQREVGRMWHQAEINIAEEHIVTSTTERAMAVLAYHAERQPANGLTVVSAAVAGNTHDIGVRVVSDFFEFAGWQAICLGADLPAMDVAQAAKFFDTSLVLLSAALSTQLKSVRETVHAVRELNTMCKIIVGGTAFQDAPELWRQLGADAYATTPADAVLMGKNLITK